MFHDIFTFSPGIRNLKPDFGVNSPTDAKGLFILLEHFIKLLMKEF